MKVKIRHVVFLVIMAAILAALVAGNVVCYLNAGVITQALCGSGARAEGEEVKIASDKGDALTRETGEESIVLLKNDGELPLSGSVTKVNLFGFGSTENGFLLKGIGSGASKILESRKVNLLGALKEAGISYNEELISAYDKLGWRNVAEEGTYELRNPTEEFYTAALLDQAKNFSDIAIVTLSRISGENMGNEVPTWQNLRTEKGTSTDSTRTYLEITQYEEQMLDVVCSNFGTVIVLLNTSNAMHCGFLEDERIDAALFVGLPGQSAAAAIPKVLTGSVTPSGKLTDTYAYEPESQPSYYNYQRKETSVQYVEDIYFGYKWYETADAEGYFDSVKNSYGEGYDGVVQYPFGFGLSYTNFSWTVKETDFPTDPEADDVYSVTVSVKNEGKASGKDVVELYSTAPYTKGGVEKEHVRLVAFAKTDLLGPGLSQDVTLTFTAYDIASYDAYDKNFNGAATYELDAGAYIFSLRTDAHTPKSDSTVFTCTIGECIFDIDPVTGSEVYNRFTDEDAYAGMPIDGSTIGAVTYLTRADFAGTVPTQSAPVPPDPAKMIDAAAEYFNDSFDVDAMPVTGKDSGLRLVTKEDGTTASLSNLKGDGTTLKANDALFEALSDYDSEVWTAFIDQLTADELVSLVQSSGFGVRAIESVGKPTTFDTDGPAGFNSSVLSFNGLDGSTAERGWTAFPGETLLGCSWDTGLLGKMGEFIAEQGTATSVSGWYAPGVNLHRSPYNGRNYEYYSEDGFLSGKLAASLVKSATEGGVYCYVKHFACDELGQNPRGVNTWLTEQNLRENYLKPFEIAVKEGKTRAIMTAYNRIGATWCGSNFALLQGVLRDEWGFQGTAITDYCRVDTTDLNVGQMNLRQGIRAGSDLWLNPNGVVINNAIDKNDPSDIACAKRAAKNALYTYVLSYNAAAGLKLVDEVFPWWIPVLVAADVVVVASVGLGIFFTFKPKKHKKEE